MDLSSIFDTGGTTSVSSTDTTAAAEAPTSISSVTTTPIDLTTQSTTPSIITDSSTTLSTSSISLTSSDSVTSTATSSGSTSSPSTETSTLVPTSSISSTTSTVLATGPSSTSSISSLATSVQITTVSNGGTQTITVINSITPTASASPSTAASISSSSSSFWSNKGAVAGTFTVVGIVIVAILIWVITFLLRRRRAKILDRENEAAAAEAANATAPVFLDDDHDQGPVYNHSGEYGGYEGGGGFTGTLPSASSHGTFNMPPMSLQSAENYPMAEFGSSLYPGASPYPTTAFMGVAQTPQPQPKSYFDYTYPTNEPHSSMTAARPGSGDFGVSEMPQRHEGSSDFYTGTTRTTPSVSRGHSVTTSASHSPSALSRNKSQGSRSLIDGYYSKAPSTSGGHDFSTPNSGESYAAHYQPGFSGMPKSTSPSRRGTIGYDDAPPLPTTFTKALDDEGADESDDDEELQPKKVLKVANE
ncbi:hypothetical protein C8R42DRAFT_684767 [Lentinula raphanica]|nr:hypothetical protein C8R42DRAFT_684767 [Lentinula raphanica]